MAFPPPPTETIDWKELGFKVREVNGHVECHYSVQTGKWSDPVFVTDPHLRIHGMSPALNYGQQAFEGLKAFRGPDNRISIFRPQLNAWRFRHSCSFICIPEVPDELFLRCLRLAVGANAAYVPPHETGGAMYIRPVAFGSCAQLGLNPPQEYTFAVFVMPSGVYHGAHPIDALVLEEFDRTAPEGTGSTKIGGNYAPVFRWSERARADGFGITLHLDSKTHSEVDEFTTAAFLGLKKEGDDKYKVLAPVAKTILKSSTSESACDLAASYGWTVEKRPVPLGELAELSEVFAAGTAAALVPIKSITYKSKDKKFEFAGQDGEPGPACVKLLTHLKGIQMGKLEDPFGWRHYVDDPSEWLKTQKETGGEGKANGNLDSLP